MCTRSREQIGCGSKPLSHLGAFRVLLWSFGWLVVELCSNLRRRPLNFRRMSVDCLSNFRWTFVKLLSSRLSVDVSSTVRGSPNDIVYTTTRNNNTKTTNTVSIKATSKASVTGHLILMEGWRRHSMLFLFLADSEWRYRAGWIDLTYIGSSGSDRFHIHLVCLRYHQHVSVHF